MSPNLVFQDNFLGVIDASQSVVGGPYPINYSTSDGTSCVDNFVQEITIVAGPSANYTLADTVFCVNDQNPFPVLLNGTGGGTFSIAPSGTIDPNSGLVDLRLTGPSQLRYVISVSASIGGCVDSFPVDTFRIRDTPNSYFALFDSTLCQSSGNHRLDTIASAAPATSAFSITDGQYVVFPGAIIGGNSINTDTLPAGGPYRIHRTVIDNV